MQFRTIVSDAVVSFFLAYMIHIMVQQPMRNCRQILIHWKQLFEVSTATNLVTVCKTDRDVVFNECTDGTFTKTNDAEEEYGSQFESSEKESITLDLASITDKLPANDSNNNI